MKSRSAFANQSIITAMIIVFSAIFGAIVSQTGIAYLILWLCYAAVPLSLGAFNSDQIFLRSLAFGTGTVIGTGVMAHRWGNQHGLSFLRHLDTKMIELLISLAIILIFTLLSHQIRRSVKTKQ